MKLNLNRFSVGERIVSDSGTGTTSFIRWLNDVVSKLQTAFNALDAQVTTTAGLVKDIATAITNAGIAIQTAQEAKDAAVANSRESALVNSYCSPDNDLSAAIDTTDATRATIIVAGHNRIYGDGTSVAVNGGTIIGLALSTTYYVTYIDVARAGGAVPFVATVDPTQAGQGNDRHLVGSITTPASGATAPSTGYSTLPPGVQSPKLMQLRADAGEDV